MKKIYILIFAVLMVLLSGCQTDNTVYFDESESIKQADSFWYTTAIVSNSGNCYVKGNLTQSINYGVKDVPPSLLMKNGFIRLYDKGDAADINITSIGGCIITESNDVYVFLNKSADYAVPTYLCSGYTQACIWDDTHIYLLSDKGEFGYISLDNPGSFTKIAHNIKKFRIEVKEKTDPTIFVLSENEKLYILDCNEEFNENENFIDNVIEFDLLVPHTKLSILSILTKEHDAFCRFGDYSLNYEGINERSFEKIGENISSVTSYGKGVAMIDKQGRASLYGYGFNSNSDSGEFFDSEVVFENVKAVFGGDYYLIVIMSDDTYLYFGRDSYTTEYTRITHRRD